jgi:hypothetical protein
MSTTPTRGDWVEPLARLVPHLRHKLVSAPCPNNDQTLSRTGWTKCHDRWWRVSTLLVVEPRIHRHLLWNQCPGQSGTHGTANATNAGKSTTSARNARIAPIPHSRPKSETFSNHAPVWCENPADRLSGPPIVVVQNPTQTFMALNSGVHADHTVRLLDQPIVEPLMIPLNVIMLRVFLHSMA